MLAKKIYVLDDYCGELIKKSLANVAGDLGITINLTSVREKFVKPLPRNYDVYILHISNIEEQDLISLREEQSWSYIFSLCRLGNLYIPREIKRCSDGTEESVDEKYAKIILQMISKERNIK